MGVTIAGGRLDITCVRVDGLQVITSLRVNAQGIELPFGLAGPVRVAEAKVELTVDEATVNGVLRGATAGRIRNIDMAMMRGAWRLRGRYVLAGPLAIGFEVTTVPEIDGGARIRVDARRIAVIGTPIPGMVLPMLAEHVNAFLARELDLTRLPVPVRLTGIDVEPGRTVLHGISSFEICGGQTSIVRSDG